MKRLKPIFKWPGGKFRLLDAILPMLPPGRRLVEPFVGSGAVFLNADYPAYLLADINPDLIGFYQALAERGDGLIEECRRLFSPDGNQSDTYYQRRDSFNALAAGAKRAALFLYLNRHGYNGLIRYNARGEFNVPFGRYLKPYFPEAEMLAFLDKTRRRKVEFLAADFRDAFKRVRKGDVVYCDPPYIPLSATANFTSYSASAFGPDEQKELAKRLEAVAAKGATAVVSNHDSAEARALYAGAARTRQVEVRRFISCNGDKRDAVRELLAVYQP